MFIFFVRHSECSANAEHKLIGRYKNDPELTEVGILQAYSVGELLRESKATRILCSNTKRAEQTALIMRFALRNEIPIEKHDFLDEIDIGEKLDNISSSSEDAKEYWDILNRWYERKFLVGFEGGERLIDVINRQCKFLQYVSNLEDKAIIVVSHAKYLDLFFWSFVFNGVSVYSAEDECFKPKQGYYTLVKLDNYDLQLISFNSCSPVNGVVIQ